MSDRYADRTQRMRTSLVRRNPAIDQPLLVGFALGQSEIAALQHVVCNYLWQSAYASGVALEFPSGPDWFVRHAAELRKLPNVTPNGVVMPKIENNSAYNQMHQIVASVVGKDLNPDEVASVFAPINVRLVEGAPCDQVDSRPRASTKMHSDIWAAEPSHSATLFLTVLGDSDTTTVDFYEPVDFPPEFQRPMKDYLDGGKLADGATRYPPSFRRNHLISMDSFCLHRTVKKDGGYRVSLDFRLIYKRSLPSDAYLDTPRRDNYLPLSRWMAIGQSHVLVSRQSINEFVADETRDAYASRLDVVAL